MICIRLESKGDRTLHTTRNAIAFLDSLAESDRITGHYYNKIELHWDEEPLQWLKMFSTNR